MGDFGDFGDDVDFGDDFGDNFGDDLSDLGGDFGGDLSDDLGDDLGGDLSDDLGGKRRDNSEYRSTYCLATLTSTRDANGTQDESRESPLIHTTRS